VVVETSNQSTWPIHLQVEMTDVRGNWQRITDQFKFMLHQPRGSVRRQATYELHRRGVDYILLTDSSWGAQDVLDDPASWGLEVIGRANNANLYKVIP
jgi:hypothetical protein